MHSPSSRQTDLTFASSSRWIQRAPRRLSGGRRLTAWLSGAVALSALAGPMWHSQPAVAADGLDSSFKLSAGSSEYGPVVSLVQPGYNDLVRGVAPIVIAVQNRRYPAKSVEMFVDDQLATPPGGVPLGAAASAQFNWDTSRYVDGPHRLLVRVTDTQGFIGVAEVTVFVNNNAATDQQAPTLSWLGVKSGDILKGQQSLPLAVSDDFGVKMVIAQLYRLDAPNSGDAIFGWFMNQPPYVVKLDTTRFPDGIYILKGKAYDVLENEGQTPPLYLGFSNFTISPTYQDKLMELSGRSGDVKKGAVPAPSAPAPSASAPSAPAPSAPASPASPSVPAPEPRVEAARPEQWNTGPRIAMAEEAQTRASSPAPSSASKLTPRLSAPNLQRRELPAYAAPAELPPQTTAPNLRVAALPDAVSSPLAPRISVDSVRPAQHVSTPQGSQRAVLAESSPVLKQRPLEDPHSSMAQSVADSTRIAGTESVAVPAAPTRIASVPRTVASRPNGVLRHLRGEDVIATPQVAPAPQAVSAPQIAVTGMTPQQTRIARAELPGDMPPSSRVAPSAQVSRPDSTARQLAPEAAPAMESGNGSTPALNAARTPAAELPVPTTRIAAAPIAPAAAPSARQSTPARVTQPLTALAALPALPGTENSTSNASITVAPAPEWTAKNANLPAHYVAPGNETLAAIAARFQIPVTALAAANGLTPETKPAKGASLQVPRPLVVMVDGRPVAGDVSSLLVGSTAVTPFRFLFEQQGGTMTWDGARHRVTAKKGDLQVTLTIGSQTALVNQKEVMMDLAAFLLSGRTMVPVRFFEDALQAEVEWEPTTGRLYIAMSTPNS